MPKKIALFVGVATAILALLALTALIAVDTDEQPTSTVTNAPGSGATSAVIYSASLPDLSGKQQSLGQWSKKLLVINFWATWCAPCLEEMPIFVRLQEKYGPKGLQIVGIAADSAVNSGKFAEKLGVNYPVLADESGAIALSKRLGNRLGLLPFTIVLTPSGDILMTKLGVVIESDFEQLIKSNLPK